MNERENGFYWVLPKDTERWEVAKYSFNAATNYNWYRTGELVTNTSSAFIEINETPILPPEK